MEIPPNALGSVMHPSHGNFSSVSYCHQPATGTQAPEPLSFPPPGPGPRLRSAAPLPSRPGPAALLRLSRHHPGLREEPRRGRDPAAGR